MTLASGTDTALKGPDDQRGDGVPRQGTGYGLFAAAKDQRVERVPDPGWVEIGVERPLVLSPRD